MYQLIGLNSFLRNDRNEIILGCKLFTSIYISDNALHYKSQNTAILFKGSQSACTKNLFQNQCSFLHKEKLRIIGISDFFILLRTFK